MKNESKLFVPANWKFNCPFSVRHFRLHRLIFHLCRKTSDLIRLNGKKSIRYSGSKLVSTDSLPTERSWVLQPVARMLRHSKSPPKLKSMLARRHRSQKPPPSPQCNGLHLRFLHDLVNIHKGGGGRGRLENESGLRSVGGANGIKCLK